MRHHIHHNPIVSIALLMLALSCLTGFPRTATAQLAVHPALDPAATPNMQRILLGDWGESVTTELLRARGYEVVDPTIGRHGLDRIAIKRDALGSIDDVRFIEVKARTAAGDLGRVGTSSNGDQLTPEKVIADLMKPARDHSDPRVKDLAREVLERYKSDPASVRVERHVLTVQDGRYTVYEGPTSSRPAGRPLADGSLDKVLDRLGKSSDPDIAARARINRAYLRAQQACVADTVPLTASGTRTAAPAAARAVAAEAGEAAAARTATAAESRFIPVVMEKGGIMRSAGSTGAGATRSAAQAVASPLSAAAGAALAGVATSGVIAGMAGYDWYQGTISDARLHEELVRAGGAGLAVGLATGAVMLLTPAAPGVVLIAVGAAAALAAEVAFDWAMERENEHLAAGEYVIRYGYEPAFGDDIGWSPQPSIPNPLSDELDR